MNAQAIDRKEWLSLFVEYMLPPLVLEEKTLDTDSILAKSRERIITTLLRTAVFFGFFASVIGTPQLLHEGQWGSLISGWGAWCVFLILAIRRKTPYSVRTAIFLFGSFSFLVASFVEQACICNLTPLVSFILIASLLHGVVGFMVSVVVSSSMILFFFGNPESLQVAIAGYASATVFELLITWLFYTLLAVGPLFILFKDLQLAWLFEREAAAALQHEQEKLGAAMAREQRLTQELQTALRWEIALKRQKTAVIENISHEFRTPLTIIKQSTEMLTRFSDKITEAKREKYQSAIQSQIQFLDNLINDVSLLNSDEAVARAIQLERVGLVHLARLLCEEWCDAEQQVAIRVVAQFTDDDERTIVTDPEVYQQIMRGLVGNAIKFSPNGEPICIELLVEENCLIVRVSDQGIGIAEDELEAIFELFWRGKNLDYQRGLGIGLPLITKLTHAIGGRIWAESAGLNKGSRFTLLLPLNGVWLSDNG